MTNLVSTPAPRATLHKTFLDYFDLVLGTHDTLKTIFLYRKSINFTLYLVKKKSIEASYPLQCCSCILNLHREKPGLSRPQTLPGNVNPRCFLQKKIRYFNSCLAGFMTSGMQSKSEESEARREGAEMSERAVWGQRGNPGRQHSHHCCLLETIAIFDSLRTVAPQSRQTNKQTNNASPGPNYKVFTVLRHPESLKFKARQQSAVSSLR